MTDTFKLNNGILIFGKHSVFSAIKAGNRSIYKIFTLKQHFTEIELFLRDTQPNLLPKLQILSKEEFDLLITSDDVHQGILLHCSKIKTIDLNHLLQLASTATNYNVVLLDNVTDTRNIGAIMRSALAFNINAILILGNIYKETAHMVKSSSGAIEYIKVVTISNLTNALEALKKDNFWIIGLSANAVQELHTIPKFNKTALILGSEAEGMRQLTEKNCDFIAKINMNNQQIDSLNISNAAAIAFYEINKINS